MEGDDMCQNPENCPFRSRGFRWRAAGREHEDSFIPNTCHGEQSEGLFALSRENKLILEYLPIIFLP